MINCLIIDDNKMARTVLRHQIEAMEFLNLVGECADVLEANRLMNIEKIDLIFLDIQMPKVSGMDFLRNLIFRPLVILITSRPDFAVEAYEYNVVDYILKPVKEERLLKAVLRAKEFYESNKKSLLPSKEYFFVKEKGVSAKIFISDILFIQAMGDYIQINTPSKNFTLHCTLTSIEKELPPEKFMRIHRSYIVALDKIDTIEDGSAYVFQNNIPISDAQRGILMSRLNLL